MYQQKLDQAELPFGTLPFLVVMGRAGCRGEAQSGATFGFGSEGWRVRVAVVIQHFYAVGTTCRKARCLQGPVLVVTALRVILCD